MLSFRIFGQVRAMQQSRSGLTSVHLLYKVELSIGTSLGQLKLMSVAMKREKQPFFL